MIRLLVLIIVVSLCVYGFENISPTKFKVELIKRCEVLGLSQTPDRKAPIIYSHAHTGSCVQNLGCLRKITQKQLSEEHNKTKQDFMAWKYPVWCKVDSDGKRGWVRKQFLADKPCEEDE